MYSRSVSASWLPACHTSSLCTNWGRPASSVCTAMKLSCESGTPVACSGRAHTATAVHAQDLAAGGHAVEPEQAAARGVGGGGGVAHAERDQGPGERADGLVDHDPAHGAGGGLRRHFLRGCLPSLLRASGQATQG